MPPSGPHRQYPAGMHVVVKGFVEDMPLWMSAVDAIITKAGPGTIAESLICGLPLVLNSYVPCQEEGNIPYVLDNKVGGLMPLTGALLLGRSGERI